VLKNDFKKLLATHYAADIFNLENAKKNFLDPELDSFE
jgi:hypothetical protein